ncbi:hypothetical protein AVEN_179956-1, partial [Araneus ventricosus]
WYYASGAETNGGLAVLRVSCALKCASRPLKTQDGLENEILTLLCLAEIVQRSICHVKTKGKKKINRSLKPNSEDTKQTGRNGNGCTQPTGSHWDPNPSYWMCIDHVGRDAEERNTIILSMAIRNIFRVPMKKV